MARPPRDPASPLLSARLLAWSGVQGLVAFAAPGGAFVIGLLRGMPEDSLRSFVFATLVLTAVALTLVNRSFSASLVRAFRRANASLALVLAGAGLILLLVLLVPPLAALFRFGPLHAADLALAAGGALCVLLLLEAMKPMLAARALAR